MRLCLLLCVLALSACASSSSSPEKSAEEAAAETDRCLADSALAKSWGECNVKRTIFNAADGIAACQRKHAKSFQSKEPLMLKIRLKSSGQVRNVRAEENGPRNKPLEGCLSREISRLQFAAPPAGVNPVIYFPFQAE